MPYEIERKFLIEQVPENLSSYPCFKIEQGYLNTDPVVRIRKENNKYYLTYKKGSKLIREEHNLPLDETSYFHMRNKCDGILIKKNRYHIPLSVEKKASLIIELDVFTETLAPLIYAEVEFPSEKEANSFIPPAWFGKELTLDLRYCNSSLSQFGIPKK